MNCQEVEKMIPDLDENALAHVQQCGRCSERLAEQKKLTAGMAAWARAAMDEQAPPAVEARLLGAFRERRTAQRRRRWLPFAVAGSIAAAVLLARLYSPVRPAAPLAPEPVATIAGVVAPVEPPPVATRKVKAPPARRTVQRVQEPAPVQGEVHFLPVAQGDGWTPRDGGRLVRVQLPRSALRNFGLPMNEERALERVQADVVLSNDGLLRAIRFVQ